MPLSSWFGRRRVPEFASFMERAEYDALHETIADALRAQGIAFRRLHDDRYRIDVHGVEGELGLATLARRFHDAPPHARGDVVRRFIADAVRLDPNDVVAFIRDWRWAGSRLRVQIEHESRVALTPTLVALRFNHELIRTLVVDLPDRLIPVLQELTETWPSTDEAWFAEAWQNTLQAEARDEVITRDGFESVIGDDYATSRVAYGAATSREPHGVVIAMPCRGSALRHVLTTRQAWEAAWTNMAHVSLLSFENGERPISPHLWWYHADLGVQRLSVERRGDGIRVAVPEGLVHRLR